VCFGQLRIERWSAGCYFTAYSKVDHEVGKMVKVVCGFVRTKPVTHQKRQVSC
jgi:hypothetical protein